MAAAGEQVYAGPVTAPLSSASAAGPMQASKPIQTFLDWRKRRAAERAAALKEKQMDQLQKDEDLFFSYQGGAEGASRFFPNTVASNDSFLRRLNSLGVHNLLGKNDYTVASKQAAQAVFPEEPDPLAAAGQKYGDVIQKYSSTMQPSLNNRNLLDTSLRNFYMHRSHLNARDREQATGDPHSRDDALQEMNDYFYKMKALYSEPDAVGPGTSSGKQPVIQQVLQDAADQMFALKEKYGLNLHNYRISQWAAGDKSAHKFTNFKLDTLLPGNARFFLTAFDKAYNKDDPRMQEALALSKYFIKVSADISNRLKYRDRMDEVPKDPDNKFDIDESEFEEVLEQLRGFNTGKEKRKYFSRSHL